MLIHLVLLSGGSGSRLWPLSNETRSKQFLKVLRDSEGNAQSMVQRVFGQLSRIGADVDITIATAESQALSIEQQLPEGSYALVPEPERRDTAPAIMLACVHLLSEQGVDPDDTVIVMPIDTYADQDFYDSVVKLDASVQGASAELVLLGVAPTCPSEKYGYIVPADKDGECWPVDVFVEKPSEPEAERLIAQGALWNCGVFAFRLRYVMEILADHISTPSYETVIKAYGILPKTSFDYAVVENARSVGVVPYSGEWKDLGTWNTLTEHMADQAAGRVIVDDATCADTFVVNETGMPLVVAGIKDAVVVATPDGILVSGKEKTASLKPLVESAAESRPMYEKRRWGEYRVLDYSVHAEGVKSLTKELVINAGSQLSYQRHRSRSEVWTIVAGTGQVVLDGVIKDIHPGSVVQVPAGMQHALRANSDLTIIEVQLGSILEEFDIERAGYFWEGSK